MTPNTSLEASPVQKARGSSHSNDSSPSNDIRHASKRAGSPDTSRPPPLGGDHAETDGETHHRASGFRQRCRYFTWTWFTLTMATGGIANVIDSVPFRFKGLYAIGCIFFILHATFFLATVIMTCFRFYYWPKAFKASFLHPTESLFIPAAVVSLATVLMNIVEYGLTPGKTGPWLVKTMIILFWIYVGFAFVFSCSMYLLIWGTQVHTVENMTPAWIFPSYPLLLAGPFASKLTLIGRGATGHHALQIIVGGVIMQGTGFMLTLMIYSAYLYRLMTQKLPHESVRPAMFISVGPAGFTVSGIIQLGTNFPYHVPSDFMGNGELAGQIGKVLAYWTGLWLFGLMFVFFLTAVGALWPFIYHGKMNFAMTWYAFVFPNSALVSAVFGVANVLDKNFVIRVFGCVLTCLLIVVWSLIFGINLRALALREILWQHQESTTSGFDLLESLRDEIVKDVGGVAAASGHKHHEHGNERHRNHRHRARAHRVHDHRHTLHEHSTHEHQDGSRSKKVKVDEES